MNWHSLILYGVALVMCIAGGLSAAIPVGPAGRLDVALASASDGDAFAADSREGWPHEQSDLAPDPQTTFGRLANGLRYVLRPNAKPADRTRLHLVVEAGSLHETDAQRGIAHFLEHMLFNGSTHFAPGELIRYFQEIGMQFGPDANARTGFYDTVYDINLPRSDRASLEEALLVLGDYAEGALLLPSEIERERGVILAEKRTRDSADYRTYVSSLAFELAETRFPERLPIGTEAVIRSADRSVFKAFYDTWYRPDNMILVMVGDFDPGLARELIEQQFAPMTARAPAQDVPAVGEVDHEGLKIFHHHEAELGATSVTIQVVESVPPPRDDRAFQQRQIAAYLTNAMLQNRLNRKIKQAGSVLTDAGAGSGIFLRQLRYGYISADCQPDDWQETLTIIEQQLRQALRHGFTEDEVARVKKEYLAGLEMAVAQAGTRESADLARDVIYSVTHDRIFRSPEQEKALAEPIVAALTAADLHERLREVWDRDHRLVLVTGNARIEPPSGTPEAFIADVFERSQSMAVVRPAQRAQVAFPYLAQPVGQGRIAARQTHEAIGVTMIRWANGVRLNLKPTDFTDNAFQFVLSFGHGRAGVPPQMPALAALAEDVVNESGLGGMDQETLGQALAGTNTQVQFTLKDDRFAFEGRSTPEEMELVFQLLHAYLVDPAFREDAWRLAFNRYRQGYRAMRRSVDGVMKLHGWRFFSGGDPRFGLPSPEALEELSAAHVENWIAPALRRGQLELAVAGDVDPDALLRLAGRYLGTLPDRGRASPIPGSRSGPDFPEARQMAVPVHTQIDKRLLVMALPTDDIWDIQRTRRLNVLGEIVSERLRVGIREKLGAAYSTAAFNWPSRAYPGYGILVIHIPLSGDTLDRVQAEVRRILLDIRDQGVSQDELQRALEPILTGIKDRYRDNGYWLDTVLADASRHPVQLEWSRTILEDYAGIDKQAIDAVARRYIDPAKLGVVRAYPILPGVK